MTDVVERTPEERRLHRWRLLLGDPADRAVGVDLDADEAALDDALGALYEAPAARPDGAGRPAGQSTGGLGSSAPALARWLGDIRRSFPTSVVQVMQRDAIERLDLASLLLEPELLGAVEPDVHLVAALIGLNRLMPETTRATARQVVSSVVGEVERRIAERTRAAVAGALSRANRSRRPRLPDVDWPLTIRRNLQHYLPDLGTVVPERLVGYARSSAAIAKDVIVAVDQSGSMAESVVYAAIYASTLASLRSLRTSLVVFDTAVVDLSDRLDDPVEVLFGCQLGGGTDINRALAYCTDLVSRPSETLLLLVSDLYEGGSDEQLLRRVAALARSGVTVVVLLALSDAGAPAYDHDNAAALGQLGVPTFACTPDAFPDVLALALTGGDVAGWASAHQAQQG